MEAGGIHEPDTIKATEYHTSILKEQSSANWAEVDNRETSKEKSIEIVFIPVRVIKKKKMTERGERLLATVGCELTIIFKHGD